MKRTSLLVTAIIALTFLLIGAASAAPGKPRPQTASAAARQITPSAGHVNDDTIPEDIGDLSCPITEEDLPAEDMAGLSPSGRAAYLSLKKGEYYCTKAQELWEQGDVDGAINSLDTAYSFLLKADAQDKAKSAELIQPKEDLRVIISQRLVEIYATRYVTAQGDNNGILMPAADNRYVKAEIALLTGPESDFFARAYARSGLYRPLILEKFRKAGLPDELSWLPLIESGFKVSAFSSARALGLWQFIASTGIRFGLGRDKFVDERMDPEKSTDAAIKYLKALHDMFGDWTTCLAAYNCGEGRVIREINRKKIPYLDNFWDLYENLPRETARYVPRFFATLMIIKDPAKYGMTLPDLLQPPTYKTVRLTRQLHMIQIAQAAGFSEDDLVALNPELRLRMTPPTPYDLKVPQTAPSDLSASLDNIPEYVPPRPRYTYYKVKRGENLGMLSKRFGISVSTICLLNHLRPGASLYVGKVLKIPTAVCEPPVMVAAAETGGNGNATAGSSQEAAAETPGATAPAKDESAEAGPETRKSPSETPKKDETPAARKGASAREDRAASEDRESAREDRGKGKDKKRGKGKKGEEKKASQPQAPSRPRTVILTHTVQKGDTIFNLAQRYNTTIPVIVKANDLPSKRIRIGQTLKLPTSNPPAPEEKASARTYKVKKGDTCASIARKFDMSFGRFLKLNKFTTKTRLKPGQVVKVE